MMLNPGIEKWQAVYDAKHASTNWTDPATGESEPDVDVSQLADELESRGWVYKPSGLDNDEWVRIGVLLAQQIRTMEPGGTLHTIYTMTWEKVQKNINWEEW
jgi:hypothetical protein